MIILAPEQPKPAPTPAPIKPVAVVDDFDRKLIEAVGQQDDQPVPLWPVIHEIIEGERPVNRTERRLRIGRVLCRARALLRRGVLVREDKAHVRLARPVKPPVSAPLPPQMPVKNWPPAPHPTGVYTTNFQGGGPTRRVFKV